MISDLGDSCFRFVSKNVSLEETQMDCSIFPYSAMGGRAKKMVAITELSRSHLYKIRCVRTRKLNLVSNYCNNQVKNSKKTDAPWLIFHFQIPDQTRICVFCLCTFGRTVKLEVEEFYS